MGPSFRGRGRGRRRRGAPEPPKRSESLREPLPDEVEVAARSAGVEPQVSVPADIAADGSLGQRWLVASAERLLVVAPNGRTAEVQLDLPLADIDDLKVDQRVGNHALVAQLNGDRVEIVRYTNAEAARFGKLTRHLNAWRRGETPALRPEEEAEPKACPRCGGTLENDVCRRCSGRRRALVRLGRYLRPHLGKTAAVVGLLFVSTFLSMLQPQLSGLLFDRVLTFGSNPSDETAGRWVRWLFTADNPYTLLSQIVLAMLAFEFVSAIIRTVSGRINAWLAYWVVHDIRSELYAHIQTLTLRYFDKRQTGAVMSRVTQDTRAMQGFLIDGTQNLIRNSIILVVVGYLLITLDWKLFLLTVIPAPLITFLATAFWRKIRLRYSRLWQSYERLTAILQDSLSGIRVVKAFAGEQHEVGRVTTTSATLADAGASANQLRATITPWLMFSVHLSTLAIWYFGGRQVLAGERSPGQIVEFLGYLMMFYGPLQWFSDLFNWFQETLAAADRVWEVLDERPDVPEVPKPVVLDDPRGHYVFENVTFGYEPHEPVLKNISLDVQPGEMIGLVGHSGAGKSTMINLICRFYDVDEGRILLDGHDLREIASEDYRRNVGVVLQDSFLFNGSIYDNIAYARPDAGVDEVVAAAYAANAHEFISNLPDGYDTMVGERGYRLSGGERQRIAIARAVLHDPKVLILDEATASVDTETERQIQEALERLIEGRTVFAIAHRLSTLRNADRLVVIDHGKIAEVGTHDELMHKEDGIFRKLVNMQNALNTIAYVGG